MKEFFILLHTGTVLRPGRLQLYFLMKGFSKSLDELSCNSAARTHSSNLPSLSLKGLMANWQSNSGEHIKVF